MLIFNLCSQMRGHRNFLANAAILDLGIFWILFCVLTELCTPTRLMLDVTSFVVVVTVLVDNLVVLLSLSSSDNLTNQESWLAKRRIFFLIFDTWLRNFHADNQSCFGLYRLSNLSKVYWPCPVRKRLQW